MDHEHTPVPLFWRSPAGIALCVALGVIGFYLLTEHTAHVFGVLPFLLIAVCPLMHLFMHHGHGGHGGHERGPSTPGSNDDEQP